MLNSENYLTYELRLDYCIRFWRWWMTSEHTNLMGFFSPRLTYCNLTWQALYVSCNIETRSCNRHCSGKTMSITQPECVCVCSLSYPACNAHAPYWHLWPATLYNIFSTLSHKRYDFRKKFAEHKMCALILRVSTKFVWNISHSKKK